MADRAHPAVNGIGWFPRATPSKPGVAVLGTNLAGSGRKGQVRVLVMRQVIVFGHITGVFKAIAVEGSISGDRGNTGAQPIAVHPFQPVAGEWWQLIGDHWDEDGGGCCLRNGLSQDVC